MLKKITTQQAAEVMGCSSQFVRVAMQRGILNIGEAMIMPGSKRWMYNISPGKLAARQGITLEALEAIIEKGK